MRTRTRYLPLTEVHAGMVLGVAAQVIEQGRLGLSLPAGHVLTSENVRQLMAHHAEYVAVAEDDLRSDADMAADTERMVQQVAQIFQGADLSSPDLAALYEQVIAYRIA
ncbi:MAG: hypothetical protein RL459_506 [Pseudomonadota bacterium]|jgi:pyridoxine 5'-phosphate synthase PdxJ